MVLIVILVASAPSSIELLKGTVRCAASSPKLRALLLVCGVAAGLLGDAEASGGAGGLSVGAGALP